MDPVTYALAKKYTDERGLFSKFDATEPPDENDDDTEGYAPGSMWVDVTNQEAYICTDASTGAAIWEVYTGLADHSAQHEAGGTDEINLDDLDGEPTNLASHKINDTPHLDANATHNWGFRVNADKSVTMLFEEAS